MTQITFVHPDGRREIVDAAIGSSIMQVAVSRGISEIVAECGGNCMCATCHVYVEDQSVLPEVSEAEEALLDGVAADRRPTSRLSCQLAIVEAMDGLIVELPDRQT